MLIDKQVFVVQGGLVKCGQIKVKFSQLYEGQ